ncbi:hypothetical protein B0H13DRAFT_1859377 [Mycena leptocephala]|nr:hypothetical protein B0H13DRAFT_1859377 [Mycena leptocephala]
MKASKAKQQSYRYTPLVVRDVNTLTLSHPRKASQNTIAQKTTTKLFSTPSADDLEAPLSGYSALSSQVGETQYFAQYGVDVALPIANTYSPACSPSSSNAGSPSRTPLLSPLSSPSGFPCTPPEQPVELGITHQYGSRLRGPLLGLPTHVDFSPISYWDDPLDDMKDMELDTWSSDDKDNEIYPGTAQPPWDENVKIEVDDFTHTLPAAPVEMMSCNTAEQAIDAADAVDHFTELTEFESWLVGRVRKSHAKGSLL